MGTTKLASATEAGERLYPHTAAEGRELIRNELRTLKADWDALYDEISGSHRQLEVSLVQWDSFEESYAGMDSWLVAMEAELHGDMPYRSTLEEKKAQLQTYRVRELNCLALIKIVI